MNLKRAKLIVIISALQPLTWCQDKSTETTTNTLSLAPSQQHQESLVTGDVKHSDYKTSSYHVKNRMTTKVEAPKTSPLTNSTVPTRQKSDHEKSTKKSGKNLLSVDADLNILGPPDDKNDDGGIFKGGWATYFTQNGIPGACGKIHQDSDVIVALDWRRYGNLDQVSKYCGRKVEITSGRNNITATVADACPTCLNKNSLDLSEGAFKLLGVSIVEGIREITWKFL